MSVSVNADLGGELAGTTGQDEAPRRGAGLHRTGASRGELVQ